MNKTVANVPYTKFPSWVVDDTVTWDNHIDKLIFKLNSACYAVRAVKAVLSRKALRMLYFAYAHSIVSYSINFWGNTLIVLKYSEYKNKY